jgi:hypothetical protein
MPVDGFNSLFSATSTKRATDIFGCFPARCRLKVSSAMNQDASFEDDPRFGTSKADGANISLR